MSVQRLPAGGTHDDAAGDTAAAITRRIAEAWRRDDDENMAWRELELRIRAARLMQDETQPRWWQWQRTG